MRRERAAWLALPGRLMRDDPNWIPPLEIHEQRRISANHNPFFTFGEAQLFMAWRESEPVGRISAQLNRRHLDTHRDATGHFGFFDCADDTDAARELIETAARWLRARGARRMVGPLSFSINEEVGVLVRGFELAPAILMGHAPHWSSNLLEQAGLSKEIDTFAYRLRISEVPAVIRRLARLATRTGRVSVRPFHMRNYRAEILTLVDVFNDAWSMNWGFVPFSEAEIDALISETRFLLRGEYGRLLFLDDEPVGVMLALPDINHVIRDFGGRLLPFNWLKLLRAYSTAKWQTARIPILGLKRALHRAPIATSLLALLVAEFLEEARNYPLEWVEFSWVLETNTAMTALAEMAAGPPLRTYRVYAKDL
jgi:hypothetical protein